MYHQVHGINTHYQQLGKGKPSLVLLHGWGCNWEIWSPIISSLTEKYQLIIPDLPAFGKSGNPITVWDSVEYSKWLAAFLETTAPNDPVILIGHSFGGKVAAHFTSAFPEKVSSLILVDASGLPADLSSMKRLQQATLSLIPQVIKNSVPRKLKSRLLKVTGSADDHLNSTPTQRAILRKTIREKLNNVLVHIPVPTLLIWGQLDQDTPLSQAKLFESLIPQSQLQVFERAGHFPFIEDPDRFIKVVTEFIPS